jgi:hypothetical protein
LIPSALKLSVKTLEYEIKNLLLCIKRVCPWGFGILGFKGKK